MERIIYESGKSQIEELLYLFDSCFVPPLSLKIKDLAEYSKKLESNAICYLARADTVCGFIVFYANDTKTQTAYIVLIAVEQRYQGSGIAERLLEKCIETSRNKGMKYLKLEVRRDNKRAIQFYKKNGFKFLSEASIESLYLMKDLQELL